jgi:hypothetical protein
MASKASDSKPAVILGRRSYPEKRFVGGLMSCDGSNIVINARPSYTHVPQTFPILVNSETRNTSV